MNNGIFSSFDRRNSSDNRFGQAATGLIQYEAGINSLPQSSLSYTKPVDGIYHYPPANDWRIDYNKIVYVIDTTRVRGNYVSGYTQDLNRSYRLFLVGIPGGFGGTAIIDWGDGTIETTSRAPYSASPWIDHFYNKHGIYTIQFYWANGAPSDGYNVITSDTRLDNRDGKLVGVLSFDSRSTTLYRFFNNYISCDFVPKVLPRSITSLLNAFDGSLGRFKNIGLWDTSNITNMTNTFYAFSNNGSTSNFNEDLSSWNTSNVTSMNGMFRDSTLFNNGEMPGISGWNTGQVTSMANMFGSVYRSTRFNQPIGSWNTSKVTNMAGMFGGDDAGGGIASVGNKSFNQDIGSWNVSGVTSIANMFYGASAFNNGSSTGINNWNTSGCTSMSQTFKGATSFNQPINNWNTSGVTTMLEMFRQATSFNQNLNNWNVQKVTTFSNMFNGATAFNGSLSGWMLGLDTSTTTCNNMFDGATSFVGNGLSNWNTSKVINTNAMFANTARLGSGISLNLSGWNLSNVTNFGSMFAGASNFTVDCSNWQLGSNTGSVNCSAMFYLATNFSVSGINTWNTNKVTNMATMFRQSSFNSDISSWDTSNVTDMSQMFLNCPFNQNISSWNVSGVTTMNQMFQSNSAFNQPIGNWNTSSLVNLANFMLFNGSFNQNLSGWNTSKVTTFFQMFYSCAAFTGSGLTNWNTSGVTSMYQSFWGDTNFNVNLSGWNTSRVNSMFETFRGCTNFKGSGLENWNLAGLNAATSLDNFALGCTFPSGQYDNILNNWNTNKASGVNGVANWRTDLRPHFGSSKYTAAGSGARAALVTYGWTFTDGGLQV